MFSVNFRLADLTCLADTKDLLVYKDTEAFRVIQDIVMNCSRRGVSLPSSLVGTYKSVCPFLTVLLFYKTHAVSLLLQISAVLLNSTELNVSSALSPDQITRLSHLLPLLGGTFLQTLTASQLLAALPALSSVAFSPAQVESGTNFTVTTTLGTLFVSLVNLS